MKVYVDILDGELNGFYSELNSKIPQTAVEITEELRDIIVKSGKQYRIIDIEKDITIDNLEEVVIEVPELPPTEIERLRADIDFLLIMGGFDDNV